MGTWAWVQTRGNRRPPRGPALVEERAKASGWVGASVCAHSKYSSSGVVVRSIVCSCCTAVVALYCCYIRSTVVASCTHTYCPAVPYTHTAVVTHTPRPCDVTGRQKRVSSNPRLCFLLFLLYSSTVYCCAIVHTWWVGALLWVDSAIAV